MTPSPMFPKAILAAALPAALLALALGGCLDTSTEPEGHAPELSVAAATVPSQFAEATVASGLDRPTAMAIAPDGRIFICQQGGRLRVVKAGALLSTPFVTLSVNSSGERGLLGVAFDPSFATNKWVYVYYTTSSSPIHNRVSRFTANGDVAAAGETQILNLPTLSSATNHNGGAMAFGPDGKLYIAVGDNANGANAKTTSSPLGKMLRINKDGSIPSDNPWYTQVSGTARAGWAMGLRNPFTFAFQPGTGRLFVNDVGQSTAEEINDIVKGGDYGWPDFEGNVGTDRRPFFTYSSASGKVECSIIGAGFYNPTTRTFPSDYTGDFFYGDYCGDWINRIDLSTKTVTRFASGIPDLVDIEVHNDGSLYYLSRNGGTTSGYLRRVRYTGSAAPSIASHPQSLTVSVGQSATFTVQANGTGLAYQWQRNGANISGATSASYTRTNIQTTDNGSTYRCVVSNTAGSATSNSATLTVTTNKPPVASISTPSATLLYQGAQAVAYSGGGTDPEDGTLPATAFTWWVDFHHDTHTHPAMAPVTGFKTGSFTIPNSGEVSSNVWYRFHLQVKDSKGLIHHVFRDIQPLKVQVTIASSPSGLQVTVDGTPRTTPYVFTGVAGIRRPLGAVSPQSLGGVSYTYVSWSDGGAQSHTVTTPASAATYTATFKASGAGTVYQAENAFLSGAIVASTQAGYTGTGYADYQNMSSDYVEWTVSVPTAGTKALDFRYALTGTTPRPLKISVNGVTVNSSLSFPGTGSWTTWGTVSLNAALNAGSNKVRATAIGFSGANIDNLTVR